MVNTIYEVEYDVTRAGFKGGINRVRITQGETEFGDIPQMLAIRRGVHKEEILIKRLVWVESNNNHV